MVSDLAMLTPSSCSGSSIMYLPCCILHNRWRQEERVSGRLPGANTCAQLAQICSLTGRPRTSKGVQTMSMPTVDLVSSVGSASPLRQRNKQVFPTAPSPRVRMRYVLGPCGGADAAAVRG